MFPAVEERFSGLATVPPVIVSALPLPSLPLRMSVPAPETPAPAVVEFSVRLLIVSFWPAVALRVRTPLPFRLLIVTFAVLAISSLKVLAP